MIAEIDLITRSLQSKGHTMSSYRADLDLLVEFMQEDKKNRDAALFECNFGI